MKGSLEVVSSTGCPLSLQDLRALLETHIFNFGSRYQTFSEMHRSTQLTLKPLSFVGADRASNEGSGTDHEQLIHGRVATVSASPTLLKFQSDNNPDWLEGVVPSSLKLQMIGKDQTSSKLDLTPAVEMDPYDFEKWILDINNGTHKTSSNCPEALDLAFSCYSKSSSSASLPLFDAAVTDYQQKETTMNDIFEALADGHLSNSTLYVVRDDMGQLSGFAAVLADIPSVDY